MSLQHSVSALCPFSIDTALLFLEPIGLSYVSSVNQSHSLLCFAWALRIHFKFHFVFSFFFFLSSSHPPDLSTILMLINWNPDMSSCHVTLSPKPFCLLVNGAVVFNSTVLNSDLNYNQCFWGHSMKTTGLGHSSKLLLLNIVAITILEIVPC